MAKHERRKTEPRHIRLYHSITGCDAWRDLSGNAIKILIALLRLDNGTRNGNLYFSARKAAEETGLAVNTAHKTLRELESHGFIAATLRGRFSPDGGIATAYRITWQAAPNCNPNQPTRDYLNWRAVEQKKEPSQKLRCTVANTEIAGGVGGTTVANIATANGGKAQNCVSMQNANIATQILYHGDGDQRAELVERFRQNLVDMLERGPRGLQGTIAHNACISKSTLSRFIHGKGISELNLSALLGAATAYNQAMAERNAA